MRIIPTSPVHTYIRTNHTRLISPMSSCIYTVLQAYIKGVGTDSGTPISDPQGHSALAVEPGRKGACLLLLRLFFFLREMNGISRAVETKPKTSNWSIRYVLCLPARYNMFSHPRFAQKCTVSISCTLLPHSHQRHNIFQGYLKGGDQHQPLPMHLSKSSQLKHGLLRPRPRPSPTRCPF